MTKQLTGPLINKLAKIIGASKEREEAYLTIRTDNDFTSWSDDEIDGYLDRTSKFKKGEVEAAPVVVNDSFTIEEFDFYVTPPKIDWLCNKLGLRPGAIHLLTGFSNAGKTFAAAHIAACVANNLPILGEIDLNDHGKVLHMCFENNKEESNIMYWRTCNGLGIKNFKNINFCKPNYKLDKCPDLKERMVKTLTGYKLCIMDNLTAAIAEQDFNDDRIRKYLDILSLASSETGCTILMLHHESKTGSGDNLKKGKGSGSIIAACGGSIHLNKNEDDDSIKIQIGKKRMVKSNFERDYTIEDVGDFHQNCLLTSGVQLIIKEPYDLYIEMLKLVNDKETNRTSLDSNLTGGKEKVKTIFELAITNGHIVTEGKKPMMVKITDEGKLYINNSQWGIGLVHESPSFINTTIQPVPDVADVLGMSALIKMAAGDK